MSESMGRRILKRRAAMGLSQQGLADKVGVTRPTVSYWENGQVRDLKGRNLAKLSEVLGVSDEWLLFGDEPKARPSPSSDLERELLEAIRRLTREEQIEELETLRAKEEEARRQYELLKQRFGNHC